MVRQRRGRLRRAGERRSCVKGIRACIALLASVGLIWGVACRERATERGKEEPLLLLEDEGDAGSGDTSGGPTVDNSRCYVCHINFDGEGLTKIHSKVGVGCEDCHGSSDAHCSDEDNITPPDRMFAKEAINSFCKGCHPDAKLKGGKKYCTDCHGKHQLEHRTRRWDKRTGELLEDDKVRMLTDEMLNQR